ncbi:MAG: hypothetical protein QOI78_5434 [Actinomycetota bacterium]|jgi:hypothetical protein|nr:hypothetical protein [Actinomycetota bacterium]
MDTVRRDCGSIVVGWLTKVVVVVAVLGVMLFDALSVTASHIGASDDASQAATAAQVEWRTSHNVQLAYNAAVESLPSTSESVPAKSFTVSSDGTVHLMVRRTTRTLIVHHVGFLKKYEVVTAAGEASPVTL